MVIPPGCNARVAHGQAVHWLRRILQRLTEGGPDNQNAQPAAAPLKCLIAVSSCNKQLYCLVGYQSSSQFAENRGEVNAEGGEVRVIGAVGRLGDGQQA